jgi:enoyl-CoA hydratase/carnithine racemase
MLDPFARTQKLSKPLIAVVHGDTWNMGHELHLVADIRVASADVRFGQDENTHGRFPGGGSTIRFPQEADGEMPCATCSPATTGARTRPTGWA